MALSGTDYYSLRQGKDFTSYLFSRLTPFWCEAGTPSGVCRERSLRAYDGVVNVAGEPTSYHLKRSHALAYAVVQKAACSDLDFCGLSPPVPPEG
jgi:hypothetical protein